MFIESKAKVSSCMYNVELVLEGVKDKTNSFHCCSDRIVYILQLRIICETLLANSHLCKESVKVFLPKRLIEVWFNYEGFSLTLRMRAIKLTLLQSSIN